MFILCNTFHINKFQEGVPSFGSEQEDTIDKRHRKELTQFWKQRLQNVKTDIILTSALSTNVTHSEVLAARCMSGLLSAPLTPDRGNCDCLHQPLLTSRPCWVPFWSGETLAPPTLLQGPHSALSCASSCLLALGSVLQPDPSNLAFTH